MKRSPGSKNKKIVVEPPVAVDLDGTLLIGDSMEMACAWMWRHKALKMIGLLIGEGFVSRAKFKWSLYKEVSGQIKLQEMKFNGALAQWLREKQREGAFLMLISATPQFWVEKVGKQVEERYGLTFDECVGSTPEINRRGKKKGAYLAKRFGKAKFDYVGNSHADIKVWLMSKTAYNVNPSKRLRKEAAAAGIVLTEIAENKQAELMEAWDDFLWALQRWKWVAVVAAIAFLAWGLKK